MVLIGLFQVRSGKCFPYLLLTREKIREKCKLHRGRWAGKYVNTGKLEKYTRNFEFYGEITNEFDV